MGHCWFEALLALWFRTLSVPMLSLVDLKIVELWAFQFGSQISSTAAVLEDCEGMSQSKVVVFFPLCSLDVSSRG